MVVEYLKTLRSMSAFLILLIFLHIHYKELQIIHIHYVSKVVYFNNWMHHRLHYHSQITSAQNSSNKLYLLITLKY